MMPLNSQIPVNNIFKVGFAAKPENQNQKLSNGISANDKRPVAIVTDAWEPQVSGVVTSTKNIVNGIKDMGYKVKTITPNDYPGIPALLYPNMKLAIAPGNYSKIEKDLKNTNPQAVHIMTEGPLGIAAEKACKKFGWSFTTAYLTKYPEFFDKMFRKPLETLNKLFMIPTGQINKMTYDFLRNFHNKADRIMVCSDSMIDLLKEKGFKNLVKWDKGVDLKQFNPAFRQENFVPVEKDSKVQPISYPGPFLINVGRVSHEKNLESFLKLDMQKDLGLPDGKGTKIIVGDGPAFKELKEKYPEAIFVGKKKGQELAKYYASSDVFVFPSKEDTFGLVNLEALASGIPVAAYPVTGPKDIIANNPEVGALDEDLSVAIKKALKLSKNNCSNDCRKFAEKFPWEDSIFSWLKNLVLIPEKNNAK